MGATSSQEGKAPALGSVRLPHVVQAAVSCLLPDLIRIIAGYAMSRGADFDKRCLDIVHADGRYRLKDPATNRPSGSVTALVTVDWQRDIQRVD
jgi:hypothetical protein